MWAPAEFRQTFGKVDPNFLRWFPGHMAKGMRVMEQKLKGVDVVVEVHDARIPFSGRNPNFRNLTGVKPHVLVLNKVDLTDVSYQAAVAKKLKQQGVSSILHTNCKKENCPGLKKFLPTIRELVDNSARYNRMYAEDISVLIFGVPNVGKSSLLNVLRNKHAHKSSASRVGAVAGITRAVENRVKINVDPPIYLLDTPGILEPTLRNTEAALRLAACSSLQDHLVGEVLIADYILYWLNKNKNFIYVTQMLLDERYDSVDLMLAKIAIHRELYRTTRDGKGLLVQVPCLTSAAKLFIKAFRNGLFGPIMLDTDLI